MDLSDDLSAVQTLAFAPSYLPITSRMAQNHADDLRQLAGHLPRHWPLEDQLVAHFYPQLESNVFSFYGADGPDLGALLNKSVLERMDSELVQRLHEALMACWTDHTSSRPTRRSPESDPLQGAHSNAVTAGPMPDVSVTLLRGTVLVSLNQARHAQWTPEHCNQVMEICTALFARQKQFLALGFEYLRPISMKRVASDVGIHESTVSRRVRALRAVTPHGPIAVRELFAGRVSTRHSGPISSRGVKDVVMRLISADTSRRPLKDSEIVDILNRRGILVARRTVAKYRVELGIPNAASRKRQGALNRHTEVE